jgi:hypothetical protein
MRLSLAMIRQPLRPIWIEAMRIGDLAECLKWVFGTPESMAGISLAEIQASGDRAFEKRKASRERTSGETQGN